MRWFVVGLFLLSIVIGCSSPPLRPIPMEQRNSLTIDSITDLTGEYHNTFFSSFEESITPVLLDDFIGIREPAPSPTQLSSLKIYPNPFRLMKYRSGEGNTLVLTGEVERIAYEPFQNVKNAIANYAFEGLLGLIMSGDDDDMAGYVQYRFHVYSPQGKPIETFVVIGASRGSVEEISRRQLLQNANRKAEYIFSVKLLQVLDNHFEWNLPSKRVESTRTLMDSITNLKLLLN